MSRIYAIKNVGDLFDTVGGTTSMAKILGVGVSTASEIKRRGRIPAEYWRDIIHAARKLGHPEITADLLVDLHARAALAAAPRLREAERSFEANSDQAAVADESNPKPTGHFSRFKHLRQTHFASAAEIYAHIDALRDEWARR